jgi:Fe/S biogenesis protein NfuA
MFNFKDLSDKVEDFNAQDYLLTPYNFFEKRRTSKKIYIFDLRSSKDFEESHLPGAHNLPFEQFEDSIYQMPFSDEIMLYGNSSKETFSAAEILFDNGYETFYIIDSYNTLIGGIDASFINLSLEAQEQISNKLNVSADMFQGIIIDVAPIMDRKANYSVQFIDLEDIPLDSISIELEMFNVLIKRDSIPYLQGTQIDLDDKGELVAFNPSMSVTKFSGSVEQQIQQVLDEEVNPMVASHGGVVSLLEVKDQNVYLEFGGGCQGCSRIDVTLKQGVEVMIKEQIPEISAIYDVTDHAGGENPYYQPSAK